MKDGTEQSNQGLIVAGVFFKLVLFWAILLQNMA